MGFHPLVRKPASYQCALDRKTVDPTSATMTIEIPIIWSGASFSSSHATLSTAAITGSAYDKSETRIGPIIEIAIKNVIIANA